jgi:FAD dependent oxidoreductase TIGR03364
MKRVAVVGAGILGLAHAVEAARRGAKVTVFERSPKACGASVRNFGMLWPIGQPPGPLREMAVRSLELWRGFLAETGLPCRDTGSLHVVYREDEAEVAREFAEIAPPLGYEVRWMNPDQVRALSPVRAEGLLGGIYSPQEVTVDPRLILSEAPARIAARWGVEFRFATALTRIPPEFDYTFVCPGDDFETLYPELWAASGVTRVKLQMMRTAPQPAGFRFGPALAAGLTLRFYPAFRICSSLPKLAARIAAEMPLYERWGIHVMASETADGAVTIGDSHEYGAAVDPFNKSEIDELILRYLDSFLVLPDRSIAERWHGVYAKHDEMPFLALSPEPGVRVVSAVGGKGMTLSFGMAEANAAEAGL